MSSHLIWWWQIKNNVDCKYYILLGYYTISLVFILPLEHVWNSYYQHKRVEMTSYSVSGPNLAVTKNSFSTKKNFNCLENFKRTDVLLKQ